MFYLLLSSCPQYIELTHLFLQVYECLFAGPAVLPVISMLASEVLGRNAFEESLELVHLLCRREQGFDLIDTSCIARACYELLIQ